VELFSLPNHLFRQVVPAARKPVTWLAVMPLVVFLAVFAAVILILEFRGFLRFSRPSAFWFALLLPWFWWMHQAGGSGLAGGRALVALLTRLSVAALFITLLAEPRAVRKSDVLSVVYALDVSDSMGEKVSDQALSWVMQSVQKKPEKDEAGLVVFGREAAVELPPRQTFPFETINSRVAKDGSDLAKALALSAAMLPEGNQGRVVLISDGNETDGAVASQLDELKSRGIAVDVLPIGFAYDKEVWLERLDLPRVVKQGETYEANVLLNSLTAGKGTLRLQENGKVIFEKEVEYAAGKNRYSLPLYLREPGYYEYVATINTAKGEDGWTENNVAVGDLFLRGEGKVLVAIDPQGDARDWEPLVAALKASERIVQVRMSHEFPRDALSLLPYDLVIFPNVPADAFDTMQLQSLRDAVYHQATGFVMLGGQHSYGPGGYHRSAVEEALPVTMDTTQKKVLPKGALAIILHTCEFAEGNTWAKRIAKEAIRVLGSQDEVGLIDFEWGGNSTEGMNWVFPLTPAGQYEKLAMAINKAQPGDMPAFEPGMKMALVALKASDASSKHLIVISDGDPSPPTPETVNGFVAAKISVSMVAINPHGGMDVSIMQSIAQTTGGRYYYPQDPAQLPSIFIKEAKTLKRSMLQNRVFTPLVEFPSPVLKGIEDVPQLKGYVLTTLKPRASMILRAPPQPGEEGDMPDPVLATWRFGLGTTAAWTSDLSRSWGINWVDWDKYNAFVKQLAQETSRVEQKSDLHLRAFANGGTGVVTVEDFAREESFLDLTARVAGPRNETVTLPLKQVAPRRYQATFPLWGKGRYQVMAAGTGSAGGKERNEQALGGFAVPYSSEYLRFRSDPILLKQVAERTGGRMLSANDVDLFHPQRTVRESSRPVFDWFLLALCIMIPLDVGVRRIQLDWDVILGWFRPRKAAASGETMGALLQRKAQVKEQIEEQRAERPPVVPPPIRPTSTPRPAAKPPSLPAPPRPAEAKPADEESNLPQSTTERLLARKRKRNQDSEQS
jgi:Ca-activated chloride channel homolog